MDVHSTAFQTRCNTIFKKYLKIDHKCLLNEQNIYFIAYFINLHLKKNLYAIFINNLKKLY
jgi:hypothetical protein